MTILFGVRCSSLRVSQSHPWPIRSSRFVCVPIHSMEITMNRLGHKTIRCARLTATKHGRTVSPRMVCVCVCVRARSNSRGSAPFDGGIISVFRYDVQVNFAVILRHLVLFLFIYFYSNVLFSLQLIVCRYVTVVDFYVPIQFYSFFGSSFCATRILVCALASFYVDFFARSSFTFFSPFFSAETIFIVSSTEAFSRRFSFIAVRLAGNITYYIPFYICIRCRECVISIAAEANAH